MNKTKLWLSIGVGVFALVAVILAFALVAAPNQEDVDAAKLEVPAGYIAESEAEQKLIDAAAAARVEEQEAKDKAIAELQAEHDAEVAELEDELQSKDDELASVVEPDVETIEGDIQDNLFLGDTVEFSIDDGDLDKLFDGTIDFKDDDYDVQESFDTSGDIIIGYSFVDDEEFGSLIPLLINEKEALEYRYEFVDVVDMTEIDSQDTLDIVFLGKPFEIVAADGDELTLRTGVEFNLEEGESVDFFGNEVTLLFVGENQRVSISVNGVSEIIDENDDTFINGVSISVNEILVNSRGGFATVTLSDVDTLYSQDDNDDFLGMEDWQFYIESNGDDLEALVVTYDVKHDDFEDALFLGDELCFPYDFICMQLYDELYRDYVTIEGSFDDFDEDLWDDTPIDKKAILLEASDNVFEVDSEEVDVLYVTKNGNVYYEDNDEWYEASVGDVEIVNEDFTWTMNVVTGTLYFDDLKFDTKFNLERLGGLEDEAENTDVMFANTKLGEREYDVLLRNGVIVSDVENLADNDEFEFQIPNDIVEAEILVY